MTSVSLSWPGRLKTETITIGALRSETNSKNRKQNKMALTPPTTYPNFFGKPITDMDGQNPQIIMTNNLHQRIYKQNTNGVLPQHISPSIGLFWADFPIFFPSETWTHLPTSIVISFFWDFGNFAVTKLSWISLCKYA